MSRKKREVIPNDHISTTEVIFTMSHYLVKKATDIKRKECWHEAHDRRILADRENCDEILGVGGNIGHVPDFGELS